ncbi:MULTISPECIES: gephyrin-like molybdotransferase Glp [Kocuria]|uniref:Molybdopterin molybdenumtransferase n=1 Tax=Kocuria gwangalliensis TaxID=501592 RepID=A0ABP8X2A4_9MICC|nr:gephyrin-like molybdotransferase Glp [Kocuria sp.]MDO5366052.1 molybdopterin molybdotransferase MoeA [Kocuria sp.]
MSRSIELHASAVRATLALGYDAAAASVEVPLARAQGGVLARDLSAPIPLPPFTNSQMDGFAVRTADLRLGGPAEAAITLPVSGMQAAGSAPSVLAPATAAAVMTGAALPRGADAVIPVEQVTPPSFDTDRIAISAAVAIGSVPGTFVRAEGSDVARGAVALPAGTVLGPAALGACAALGMGDTTTVTVRRGPSVLVITGGDEVLAPGEPLKPGAIHDANGPLLSSWLRDAGACSVTTLSVTDDPDEFSRRLRECVESSGVHLIVTSGGISAGAFEVVRVSLEREAQMWFGHVAMQPGGPQGCGQYRGVPVICLPGNPVSTWVSCEVFLRPALAHVWGCCAPPLWSSAVLAEPVRGLPGRTQLRRGVLETGAEGAAGNPAVRCVGGASSHLLMSAARANVLLRIPAGDHELPVGTRVHILPVHGGTIAQEAASE